jgi:hypothetical protein
MGYGSGGGGGYYRGLCFDSQQRSKTLLLSEEAIPAVSPRIILPSSESNQLSKFCVEV